MTLHDVRVRLAAIEASKGDDEAAHSMEDTLYLDLLWAIANDKCPDPVACAAEAVKAASIDFERWCA